MSYIFELYLNFPYEYVQSRVIPVSINTLRNEDWKKLVRDEIEDFIEIVENDLMCDDLNMRK